MLKKLFLQIYSLLYFLIHLLQIHSHFPDNREQQTQFREIAEQLTGAIPLSVRDKAVAAALNLLAQAKREKENRVVIKKTDAGYKVTCHISGGDVELMQFSLYAPDLYQARLIKHQFHSDPECVYRILLAAVTGNADLAEDSIRRMNLHRR